MRIILLLHRPTININIIIHQSQHKTILTRFIVLQLDAQNHGWRIGFGPRNKITVEVGVRTSHMKLSPYLTLPNSAQMRGRQLSGTH